jgi:hypothetical protein
MTAHVTPTTTHATAMTTRAPAIGRTVARRELGTAFLAALLLAPAIGLAAAHLAAGGIESGGSLIDRLVRRFDYTALFGAVLFTTLRIATRLELDERDLWLDPYFAAGGSRTRYVIGVAGGTCAATFTIFALTAAAFAAGAYVFADTAELLRALPFTLGAGLLLAAAWAAWTLAAGVLLRRSVPTFFAVAALLAPHLVTSALFMRSEPPGFLLTALWRTVPPIVLPMTISFALIQLCSIAAMTLLTAIMAERRIGRRT